MQGIPQGRRSGPAENHVLDYLASIYRHRYLAAAVFAVVVLVAVLFRSTVPGFMLDILGRNRQAAIHAGMPVARLTLGALLASGALAGLAGANDILGVKGLFQGNWNPGYGFAAFAGNSDEYPRKEQRDPL